MNLWIVCDYILDNPGTDFCKIIFVSISVGNDFGEYFCRPKNIIEFIKIRQIWCLLLYIKGFLLTLYTCSNSWYAISLTYLGIITLNVFIIVFRKNISKLPPPRPNRLNYTRVFCEIQTQI